MAFAADRDLAAIEPNVFRDVAWIGQRLISATGDVAGTTLTLTTFDHDLASVGVGAGSVVLIGRVAHEVIQQLSTTTAEVSKIRAGATDATIPPDAGTGLEVLVFTLKPQLAMAHREVLRLVGIDADDPQATPGEAQVVNPQSLVMLEALGALHLAYAAAGALSGGDSVPAQRATMYARLVCKARVSARVELDLDGDGVVDAVRRANVVGLLRG